MAHSVPWQVELEELRALSVRIGSDPSLIQGAGGNTSLKVDGTLWIKASGTWLAHALARDIMVPVEIAPLLAAVADIDPAAEQAHKFTIASLNASGLRPSIETTVHALMPHRVVLHVHCVDTIAFAVRTDCVEQVAPLLEGLNWAHIPYARPGLPLALAISEHKGRRPDVLVLANHGLVVAAETVAAADMLLEDIKARLRIAPRATISPDVEWLKALAAATSPPHSLGEAGGGETKGMDRLGRVGHVSGDASAAMSDAGLLYRLPHSDHAHAAATDPVSLELAARGSMYPDHVIFLGEGSAVAYPGEDVDGVIRRFGKPPISILFPGAGVLMRSDAPPNADAMARCLADVAARIPADAPVRVLTAEEHHQLTDWDAEKYRQELARKAAAEKKIA